MIITGGLTLSSGLRFSPDLLPFAFSTPALMNGSTTSAYMYSIAVNSAGKFVAIRSASSPMYASSTGG